MPAAPATPASSQLERSICCEIDQPLTAPSAQRSGSVGSSNAFSLIPAMDARLLLVVTPILLAAGWAGFNIGRAAVGQLQLLIKRANG